MPRRVLNSLTTLVKISISLVNFYWNMKQMESLGSRVGAVGTVGLRTPSVMIVQAMEYPARNVSSRLIYRTHSIGLRSGTVHRNSLFDTIFRNLVMSSNLAIMEVPVHHPL